MAARFKKFGARRRHFIAEWRRYRGLNQERLAERLGTTAATLSRIENRQIPYSQDFLEAAAEALNCEPSDLIMRNPETPEAPWSVWEQISPADRQRVIEILRALARSA